MIPFLVENINLENLNIENLNFDYTDYILDEIKLILDLLKGFPRIDYFKLINKKFYDLYELDPNFEFINIVIYELYIKECLEIPQILISFNHLKFINNQDFIDKINNTYDKIIRNLNFYYDKLKQTIDKNYKSLLI